MGDRAKTASGRIGVSAIVVFYRSLADTLFERVRGRGWSYFLGAGVGDAAAGCFGWKISFLAEAHFFC